jgi:hypothetical protein
MIKPVHFRWRTFGLLSVVLALVLSSLACGIGKRPVTPAPPIPITTESVEQLQTELQTASTQIQSGNPFELKVTEEQITSAIAFQLQQSGNETFTEPQVYLRDGLVQLFTTVKQGKVTAYSKILVNVRITSDGYPAVELNSVELGTLPVTQAFKDQLNTALQSAVIQYFKYGGEKLYLDSITIADGIMTIQGHQR